MDDQNPADQPENAQIEEDPVDDGPVGEETEEEQNQRIAREKKEYALSVCQIRQCYLKGLRREEIFAHLCSPSDMPTSAQISEYFRTMNDHDCYSGNNIEHCELVLRIKSESSKLQSGISTWPCDRELNTFVFLDSRYALNLVLEESGLKLFILDCYHEKEMREIQLVNAPDMARPFGGQMTRITSDLWLIYDHHWEREHINFYLARLDLNQGKCTFLDSQTFVGPLWDIIFDKNDRTKFLLWSVDNSMEFGNMYLAHVEDDSRLVINQNFIQMEDFVRFGRLDGDKLHFLLIDFDVDEEGRPIDGKKGTIWGMYSGAGTTQSKGGKWFGNICTSIGSMYSNGKGLVYLLDLDARQMTTDRVIFYGSPEDHYLEDGNILTIYAFDYDHGYSTIQRFTLNQPDTLVNLAYFKIRREAIFNGSAMYEKLLPKLPAHLKPFAAYPSLRNIPGPSNSS